MKQIAKISGIAYLLIFLTGFYANFAILESLIDVNDPSKTALNLHSHHSQLGFGLISFAVMLSFDAVLVWSLFFLTKSVNKIKSFLASIFRLLHACFFGFALFQLWNVYQLIPNTNNAIYLQNEVSDLLTDFDTLWTVGLLFFGVHLIILGYLIIKSIAIPKAIGILLIIAAIGYIIDGTAKLMMSDYIDYKDIFEVIVIMPSVIGEFSFTVWLLLKGFRK